MFRSILDEVDCAIDIAEEPDGSKSATIPIACCAETGRITTIDCKLSPTFDNIGHFWEFSFAISVTRLDDSDPPFSTQDRNMALPYIPYDARPRIMEVVCAALRAFVGQIKPDRIYRVTKARNPPPKALRKHHLLTDVLIGCGYYVTQTGTDPWGRTFWLCEKGRSC
jgi:hypothetical protein